MKLMSVFKNFAVGAAFLASGEEFEKLDVPHEHFPTDTSRVEQPPARVDFRVDKPFRF